VPVLDEPIASPDVEDLEALWAREPRRPAALPAAPPATLTLLRDAPNDFSDRQILVWVDGKACGKIKYGTTLERELEPGHHEVRVHNTLLSRTLAFHATPGEHVRLRCGNRMPTAGVVDDGLPPRHPLERVDRTRVGRRRTRVSWPCADGHPRDDEQSKRG
jgi:hypothetical protein